MITVVLRRAGLRRATEGCEQATVPTRWRRPPTQSGQTGPPRGQHRLIQLADPLSRPGRTGGRRRARAGTRPRARAASGRSSRCGSSSRLCLWPCWRQAATMPPRFSRLRTRLCSLWRTRIWRPSGACSLTTLWTAPPAGSRAQAPPVGRGRCLPTTAVPGTAKAAPCLGVTQGRHGCRAAGGPSPLQP